MKPLIVCDHVDFGYENIDAVIDLNLTIYEGDYLCIVGENGAGKSTLIKGLLGLLKPTSGTITIDEELKNKGIGYLPQQTEAQRDFPASVFEVVISGTLARRNNRPFYTKAQRQAAKDTCRRLGISDLEKRCYRDLSGGQQQRVLIARALCATSALLILDEPVAGLDPLAMADFYHLVKDLNKDGITIVMVSHDVANVVPQAGRVLELGQRVLFDGPASLYAQTHGLYVGKAS